MKFYILKTILEENNIPDNAVLMSDSGWECDATNMDGIYYNEKTNVIVFTQCGDRYDSYYDDPDWKLLYGKE